MKGYHFYILLLVWSVLSACDDGKIYDEAVVTGEEGRTLKMTGHITGINSWPDEYSVVVAGFGEGEFAVISKTVPAPVTDEEESRIILTGISEEVNRVELCVINKLRRRIITFIELDCSNLSDTLIMEVGRVDAAMFRSIQKEIFSASCISCHGQSGNAAAELYLTEGKSFGALVNIVSVKDEEKKLLVEPGNTANSFLYQVLNTEVSIDWRTNHSDLVTSPSLLTMLDNWIRAGAKE